MTNAIKRRKIIIDTDPGIDDAAALAVAFRHPALDIQLITTVGANVTVDKTTANALKLVEFFDVDIPVARGCPGPLVRTHEPSSHIHGESGMDGYAFPPIKRKPIDLHAVEAMRQVLMNSDEKITLIPIGSQTNIAILFHMYPEVKEKIDEIICMGGSTVGGNVNSAAEFNYFCDPHAAFMVLKSGVPITMMGLNVTNRACATKKTEAELKKGGRVQDMLYGIMEFYKGGTFETGIRLHDVCPICYMIHPEFFKMEKRYIDIVLEGPAAGSTVMQPNFFKVDDREPKVNFAMDVDSEAFEQWFIDEITK